MIQPRLVDLLAAVYGSVAIDPHVCHRAAIIDVTPESEIAPGIPLILVAVRLAIWRVATTAIDHPETRSPLRTRRTSVIEVTRIFEAAL